MSDSYPGAIWQCPETVLVITAGGEGQHYWHLVGRGQDKQPTAHSTALTSKNYAGQNVSSTKGQTPWTRGNSTPSQKQGQP